ncbi:hypothetical protein B566_EDAN002116 [Ephemera danica]|nr:hypothetical protein B566_EDAN002116 [Ephemera danica]
MARKMGALVELRALMRASKYVGSEPLHAYIIPSGDAHQSEYLADCDKRRAFISGFTGSAGTAVVTESHACMWTDGRYFLQAAKEMSADWTLMKEGVPNTPTQAAWLAKTLTPSSRVGFDPHLLPLSAVKPLKTLLEPAGISLVPVEHNLVDAVWASQQPCRPKDKIIPLPVKYTGMMSAAKVASVREQMAEKSAKLLVLTALDQVAWLLNLRGSDISYNPVFFAYASIGPDQVCLFVDSEKMSLPVEQHFTEEGLSVTVRPYRAVRDTNSGEKIWISEGSSFALCSLVPEFSLITEITPVALMKTIKNQVEIQGMINCHVRDAAALCCYFAWLEREVLAGNLVTEISGADKLEQFRKKQEDYVGLSFETISSVGPNAAIIHYTPHPDTDRPITDKDFYLCDSGGQYRDGTTDVTRTIHLGQASLHERQCFTRGNCLDTLARKPLWDVGLDYMHGTSHGIGSYLNVHEGPIGVSWRTMPDDPGMQADMFLSNEPGYYEDGNFGIRIENIVRTIPAKTPFNFKERGFLTFEDVTVVPVQRSLLVRDMLTDQEVAYLNAYHNLCQERVAPLLSSQGETDGLKWLQRETAPLQ